MESFMNNHPNRDNFVEDSRNPNLGLINLNGNLTLGLTKQNDVGADPTDFSIPNEEDSTSFNGECVKVPGVTIGDEEQMGPEVGIQAGASGAGVDQLLPKESEDTLEMELNCKLESYLNRSQNEVDSLETNESEEEFAAMTSMGDDMGILYEEDVEGTKRMFMEMEGRDRKGRKNPKKSGKGEKEIRALQQVRAKGFFGRNYRFSKILFWNIRRLGSDRKKLAAKEICRRRQPDIFVIIESKLSGVRENIINGIWGNVNRQWCVKDATGSAD
ncbi:uncharacterized protein LOC143861890 [Tasmannia lanceolata]|uniref:uncharacterized protein LOC143861890 n=1 Tax=Tasmannia lanceolata TaxID=3420 RepID=UPI004062E5E3